MKKKNYSRFISAFLSLIMAVAVIAIIYATVSVDNKSIFGYRLFIVATGSMTGTIDAGDIILTKSVPTESLKVGNIITFISNNPEIMGKPNTHRIIKIVGDLFYTRGDANPQADSLPTTPSNIIGKVVFHSKFVGLIIRTLSRPLYMLLFLVIPIGYIAITDIRNSAKKVKSALKQKRGENEDENAGNNEDITPTGKNNEQFDNHNIDTIDDNDDSPTSDGL